MLFSWLAFAILQVIKVAFLGLSKLSGAWIDRWLNSPSDSDSGTKLFFASTVVITLTTKKRKPTLDWFGAFVLGAVFTTLIYAAFLLALSLIAGLLQELGVVAGNLATMLVTTVIPAISAVAGFFTFLWFACQLWLIVEAKIRGDERGYLRLTIELEHEAFAELWSYIVDKLINRWQS